MPAGQPSQQINHRHSKAGRASLRSDVSRTTQTRHQHRKLGKEGVLRCEGERILNFTTNDVNEHDMACKLPSTSKLPAATRKCTYRVYGCVWRFAADSPWRKLINRSQKSWTGPDAAQALAQKARGASTKARGCPVVLSAMHVCTGSSPLRASNSYNTHPLCRHPPTVRLARHI